MALEEKEYTYNITTEREFRNSISEICSSFHRTQTERDECILNLFHQIKDFLKHKADIKRTENIWTALVIARNVLGQLIIPLRHDEGIVHYLVIDPR